MEYKRLSSVLCCIVDETNIQGGEKAGRFRAALRQALPGGEQNPDNQPVVLDLTRLVGFSGDFLDVLEWFRNQMASAQSAWAVCGLSSVAVQVLDLLAVPPFTSEPWRKMWTVFDTAEQAAASGTLRK